MLSGDFLYNQNVALIALALFALLLVASEIGFRRGRAVGSSPIVEASKSQLFELSGSHDGVVGSLARF